MTRNLESGKRNACMTLQKQIVIPDAFNARKEVFLNAGEPLWGHVRWLKGVELMEARKLGARKPVEINTPYRDDITEDDQLVVNGQVVKIESIINIDERNAELLISGEARP